jgi:hypothetical protein
VANPIRRLRWVVGLALAVGTAYVGWQLLQADIRPVAPIVERRAVAPPGAAGQADGGAADGAPEPEPTSTYVDGFVGERFESVRGLTAGRGYLQDDGSWRLERGVTIRLEARPGEPPLLIRSVEGSLPADADGGVPLVLRGDVEVESEDGLRLDTQELEVHRSRTLVVAPGPATFSRGEATGSAGSLEHDWGARETRLAGGATVVLAGAEVGDAPITVRGSRLRFDDARNLVEVRGRGSIDLEGGRVSGEELDVHLARDRREVRRVEATGGAETPRRASSTSSGPRAPWSGSRRRARRYCPATPSAPAAAPARSCSRPIASSSPSPEAARPDSSPCARSANPRASCRRRRPSTGTCSGARSSSASTPPAAWSDWRRWATRVCCCAMQAASARSPATTWR